MLHDIDRMDIPDRHRLLDDMTRKHTHWTDIGEAEVRNSLFGRAKVRIHRRRDDVLRAVRWMVVSGTLGAALIWALDQWAIRPQAIAAPEAAQPEDKVPLLTPIIVPPAPVVRVIEPQVRSGVSPTPAAPAVQPAKPLPPRVSQPVAPQAAQVVVPVPVKSVPPAAKVTAPVAASAVQAVPPHSQSAPYASN